MEKYDVLISFTDSADKGAPNGANVYWIGGKYPRDGYNPNEKRLAYLRGADNRFKRPIISGKPKG